MELELVALRHQLFILPRQRPGRPRIFAADRLLRVWLYRIWPNPRYPSAVDRLVLGAE
jgi:putative transposase